MLPVNFPSGARLEDGPNGLRRVRIQTQLCDAENYLHVAHVTHYHPRHQSHPVLWMSTSSVFECDKPIRGGVPICFPWLGPKPDDAKAPAHGFGRLLEWELEHVRQSDDGSIMVAMKLQSNNQTRRFS